MTTNRIFFLAFLFLINCQSPASKKTDLNDFPFLEVDVTTLTKGYEEGDFTITEVTSAYLNRIAVIDASGPNLRSIIQVNPEALEIASVLDQELKEGKIRGPLHGVPVVLKDNIDTHDKMSTTAGSRALEGSKPLKDSHVAKKL